MSYTGGHDMRLLGIENKVERLIIFCILSEEVGKPSDKFVEDFITNFCGIIKNNNWYIPDDVGTKLNKMIENNDANETDGGVQFYLKIPNNLTAEQLREYIDNYRCELPPSIEVVKEQTTDTISDESIIIEDKAIDGGDDMIDWLKHDCLLDVKGTTRDRGSFSGIVEYNAESKKFIIKAGSKTAEIMAESWDGNSIMAKLFDKYIDRKTRIFKRDYEVRSLSLATTIITMRINAYQDVYIHNTNTNFEKARDNKFVYKTWIESGRSKYDKG